MKISKYRKTKSEKLKRKAFNLYRTGISSREVGKKIGRSHEWVIQAVKAMEEKISTV